MTSIRCRRARIQSSVGQKHDLLGPDQRLRRRGCFRGRKDHRHVGVDAPAGRRRQRLRDDVVQRRRGVRRSFFTGTALERDKLLLLLLMLLRRRMLSVTNDRDLSRLQCPLSRHDDDRLGRLERPRRSRRLGRNFIEARNRRRNSSRGRPNKLRPNDSGHRLRDEPRRRDRRARPEASDDRLDEGRVWNVDGLSGDGDEDVWLMNASTR